jgi:ATP-dependent exoDNAse (exonuclease V) beta subunit
VSEGRTPTPEQKRAIASRDRDVLLEAGAGTGKTGVLVDRYCALITEDGHSPDELLAFTFTEKAAAQLRERIRAELRDRGAFEYLAGFGGAPVTTIHAFCRRLLATHPVAAGIDPGFRVLDRNEAERAARAAFDEALGEFLDDASDPERATTIAAYRVDGLRDVVFAAHEELRSRGVAKPVLPEPPANDPDAALADLEACATAAAAERSTPKIARAQELAAARGTAWPEIDDLLRQTFDAKDGARGACVAAIKRAAAELGARQGGEQAYRHVAELVTLFGRRFAAVKAARSGLDFEDLQLGAVGLLTDSPPIRDSYRGRFAHILVDEFQDTNELQLSLIGALRGDRTRLFLVGDEFQSIYGFRHADVDVFRGQRDAFATDRGSQVLRLSGNFRSRPGIIAAANTLGSRLIGDEFLPLTVGAEGEPAAEGGPEVELLLTERDGWEEHKEALQLPVDDTTHPRYVAEARFVAERLRRLADEGVPRGEMVVLLRAFTRVDAIEEALDRAGLRPYVVGGRGYWSQQQVEDVRNLLAVVANPLDDEPLLGALASPACGVSPDTLWLLRQARGGGRSLWPGLRRALGFGEGGLEDEAWLAHIPGGELERIAAFHAQIAALREAGTRLGIEELIERAVTDTGYDLAALSRRAGRLRMANIRKLMRLAREFERREGRDLRGFLDYLEFRGGTDDEATAATETEDHDGVRVMTVHNAKGLEFGVVAVPDLDRGALTGGRDPLLRLGREKVPGTRVGMRYTRLGGFSVPIYALDELKAEQDERDAAETLRLFYVAATRARRRLILSGVTPATIQRPPKPTTSVLARIVGSLAIGEAADGDTVELEPPAPRPGLDAHFAPGAIVVRRNEPSAERAAELVRAASALAPLPPLGEGPPPIVAHPAPPAPIRPLSYSALSAYERCGYRFYVERVLGLPARERGGHGAATREERFGFGSAVHAMLEWSAAHDWQPPGEELVERLLRAQGLESTAESVERAIGMTTGWTQSDLCAVLGRPGTALRAEVPLLIALGGSVVRGSIDLFAEAPGEAPLVLDYKTDRLDDGSPAERAAGYGIQRDLYAVAAAEATGAEGVRVAYVFLEAPGEPAITQMGADEIASAGERLEGLVARIGAGEFEVTAEPDWPLCHDCPARRRLCSGPAKPPVESAPG